MRVFTRYTLLMALQAARLSLPAEVISVCSCSLRAMQRSSRQAFLYAVFRRLPLASRCSLFAAFFLRLTAQLLLAAPFLLFAVLYSLLASQCSVLSSRCLIIISLNSPLVASCSLYITWCNAARYSQTRLSLSSPADRCTQTVDCCSLIAARYSFLATFSSLGRCSVLGICSRLLASCLS